ncbi:LysR family transcriptional regulator [Catenulispora sp. NF23]|uniref:LysR family transcriptional regulator n=1 Tax=Catenulispora pinistramenti TaxID=2705254 RepID=UPI001BAD5729|nr:LysR family transcriptional regulator [Catenulispora pinistramenti]MBS2540076.1 LysR family transcriptional regulator [Catenulispora pinistramenti]
MMDVRRLEILREVARRGSFAKAAAALTLTPSAVSQQIAALERSLGLPVVERSPRGVRLTEPGRIMVDAADAVTGELRDAQARIDHLVRGATGSLSVAAFTTGGQLLLPDALARLLSAHPGIDLTVQEADAVEGIALVRDGKADLAIAYHYGEGEPDGASVSWSPLTRDPLSVVLPAGHPLADRPDLDFTDLAGQSWVLGCHSTAAVLERHAALAGHLPNIVCRSSDFVFAQSLVAAGVGISLVPRLALAASARDPLRGGDLVAVALRSPAPVRHIGAVTARRRWPQPLVTEVLRSLREFAAGLDENGRGHEDGRGHENGRAYAAAGLRN